MSVQQRKDEILAKKAKLAELRKTRAERDLSRANRGELNTPSDTTASTTPNRRESRQEIDALISSLVDRPQSGRISRDGSPASKGSRPNSFYGHGQVLSEATSPGYKTPNRSSLSYVTQSQGTQTLPDEDSQGTEVAPPRADTTTTTTGPPATPKPEYVSYSVGIQTDPLSPRLGDDGDVFSDLEEPGSPGAFRTPRASKRMSRRQQDREAELRENIRQELEAELRSIKDPPGQAEKEEAAAAERFPARALTDEELNAVGASETFTDFIERSSKLIERALDEEYDLLTEYAIAGDAGLDDDEDGYGRGGRGKGRRMKEVARFYDDKWSKRRMISDINFSPKFPELVLAAYARSSGVQVDYAGCVQVWNMHMQGRPEYVFHATSDVLTAKFSPFHPSYIVGGSYSGQVLLWDTRSRSTVPVSKTPLSGASAGGHTHPVYSVDIVGTQNANNIISTSTDGVMCAWSVDMLQQPQEFLELYTPPPARTDELSPTCMAFPPADPTSFFVGTEEGSLYSCHRYDRAGAKAGVDNRIRYRGHTAPVMGLDFHSARGPVDLSDLALTSSLDWSVKLWKMRNTGGAAGGAGARGGAGATGAGTTTNTSGGTNGNLGPSGAGGGGPSTLTRNDSSTGRTGAGGAGAGTAGNAGNYQEIHPILEFSRDDVVYDARWSPTRPAVFALVDGAGNVEVWDLLVDTEIPVSRGSPSGDKRVDSVVRPTPVSLNKVAWDQKDGKRLAVGGAAGLVTVFELGEALSGESVKSEEWANFKKLVSRVEREGR